MSRPCANFVCRDPRGLAGLVPRGHCLTVSLSTSYPAKNRSSPSSSARLQRRHYLNATARGVGTPNGRSPKVIHPETRTGFAASRSECSKLRLREIEYANGNVSINRKAAAGWESPPVGPQLERNTARGRRPPRLFHVSGKSPLGTCHRGGTFYVLRLPQRTAVSSPNANFMGRDPRTPRRNRAPWSRSRCPPATRQRIEEQPEFLCTAAAKTLLESNFPWRREFHRSLTQSRPPQTPDGICRWLA